MRLLQFPIVVWELFFCNVLVSVPLASQSMQWCLDLHVADNGMLFGKG